MPKPPELTPEQRQAALEKAAEARRVRSDVKNRLKMGSITLPELHVDVHVYSESSEDRFVFINMNKHIEGSRLAEGPLVREITRNGVVLDQNGTTFRLPRD